MPNRTLYYMSEVTIGLVEIGVAISGDPIPESDALDFIESETDAIINQMPVKMEPVLREQDVTMARASAAEGCDSFVVAITLDERAIGALGGHAALTKALKRGGFENRSRETAPDAT